MKKDAHILFIVLFVLLPVFLFAQPGNPGNAPISGGLVFLLIGGLTLGVIKLRKKTKAD
jgi:hypothetical protein